MLMGLLVLDNVAGFMQGSIRGGIHHMTKGVDHVAKT